MTSGLLSTALFALSEATNIPSRYPRVLFACEARVLLLGCPYILSKS
jgi:hypothetical protein